MKKDEIIIVSVMTGIGLVFALIAIAVESSAAKWIWGILAVAVIGLVIYLIIDSIASAKRQPMGLADMLIQSLEEQTKKPGFKADFEKRMEKSRERRKILFDSQRPNDEDYGYSLSNPIMTSTIAGSDIYLSKLRTLDGKGFTWERQGSYCMNQIDGIEYVMVDGYQLFLSGEKYKMIYICPYGHSSAYVPKGMKMAE